MRTLAEFLPLSVFSTIHVASCHAQVTTLPLIPHHVQRERYLEEHGRRAVESSFRRREEAKQVGAMYHGYGTHYMDLWCGTPPQRQTVIVDTGSGVTAFPCSECNDCGAPKYHIDGYFIEADSSTFKKSECGGCRRGSCQNDQCLISMSYAEGSSWKAYEATDSCYVGGPHNVALTSDNKGTDDLDPNHAKAFAFPLIFGCQFKVTGLFKTQLADGIMGMESNANAFWRQMFDAGKIGDRKQFSLCFSRPPEVARDGTEAGAMTLGGTEPRMHSHEMVYSAQAAGRSGFFSVKVRNIFLREGKGGESAKPADPSAKIVSLGLGENIYSSGGVIVDSGTTDTYWNRGISAAFKKTFQELAGVAYDHNSKPLTAEELAALPTILFQIQGDEEMNKKISDNPNTVEGLAGDLDTDHPYDIILALPPSHYMELDERGKYTARFYDTEGSGSVLGANAIMGHDVLFDVDNNRIGWAESDCDYNKVLTASGYTDVLQITEAEAGKVKEEKQPPTEKENPPAEGNDTSPPAEGNDTSDIVLPGDKKKPSDGSDHDSSSPTDDIKKAMHGYADACTSNTCRGGALGVVLLSLLLFCCCCKFCCCRGSRGPNAASYAKAELELSSYKDNGGYSDVHGDEDDAEYGDFVGGNGREPHGKRLNSMY